MSILFNDTRNLTPNWRSPHDTILNGELDNCFNHTVFSDSGFSIEEYVKVWRLNRAIPYAGELVAAAIANGSTDNKDVREAAEFILEHNYHGPDEPLHQLASSLIDSSQQTEKPSLKSVIDPEQKKKAISQNISYARYLVRQYPFSSYRHLELARHYMSSGLWEKAKQEVLIAVHLAPNDRYVSRCAVRCFLHVKDADQAKHVLNHNKSLKTDPWLIASDIVIDSIRNKSPRSYKWALQMIDNGDYTPRSLTELSMSLAMLEYQNNGKKKKIRKYVDFSLIDPIDNSLAQAQWLSNKEKVEIDLNASQQVKFDYEVETITHLHSQEYAKAFEHSLSWIEDSTFSRNAIITASNIATIFLDNINDGINILRAGLIANPNAAMLLNNLAYHLLKQGKVEEGATYLQKINETEVFSAESRICITATTGLLCFRKGDITNGKVLYESAIADCKKVYKPELEIVARINYARELALANEIAPETAIIQISNLPDVTPSIAEQKLDSIKSVQNIIRR